MYMNKFYSKKMTPEEIEDLESGRKQFLKDFPFHIAISVIVWLLLVVVLS